MNTEWQCRNQKYFTAETRRRPGFLGAHASSVQQQSNGHHMHARGVRSQENSGKNSFQAAKNLHVSSTDQHGLPLVSPEESRSLCRARRARSPRKCPRPPVRHPAWDADSHGFCGFSPIKSCLHGSFQKRFCVVETARRAVSTISRHSVFVAASPLRTTN